MEPILRFKKVMDKENVFFDEFFHDALEIDFISFNFDGYGSALAYTDGVLQSITCEHVRRILFGIARSRLDNFIRAIYDSDFFTEDLVRHDGVPQFRIAELKSMEKYSVQNKAKQVHKELETMSGEQFNYFTEIRGA